MNYVGIDVGLSGAIAVVDNEKAIEVDAIDVVKVETGAYKRWYDVPNILSRLISLKPYTAVLEYQRPMPKQGVASMFRLGRGFGTLEGLLAATAESYQIVDPKAWQNYFIKKYLLKEEQNAFKTKDIEYIKTLLTECDFKEYFIKYSNLKSSSLTKLRSIYVYYKLLQDSNFFIPVVKDHNKIDAILISMFCALNDNN